MLCHNTPERDDAGACHQVRTGVTKTVHTFENSDRLLERAAPLTRLWRNYCN